MAGQAESHASSEPIRPNLWLNGIRSRNEHSSSSVVNKNPENPQLGPVDQGLRDNHGPTVPVDAPAGSRPGSSTDGDPIRVQEGDDCPGVRRPVVLKAPFRVSREEREAHEITHTPYRSWCPYCVRGRGRNTPHRLRSEDAKHSGIPKIAMDYVFMSVADEAASSNPVLVMVDEATGERYARAVGHKGTSHAESDWLVRDISEELKSWGHQGGEHGHIIMKTDGEAAIVALRDAVAKFHGGRVVPELPPRGHHQSNGLVEEAGKTTREYCRVLKLQIEGCSGYTLETTADLTQWLIRWAAMLISRYSIGRDGLTPIERRRGRPCRLPTCIFGECVWYRLIRVGESGVDKFDTEWRKGVWLGHTRNSNEHVIGTAEGVLRAYSIKRLDPEERWNKDLIAAVRGTPQQPDPRRQGFRVPIRVSFDEPTSDGVPPPPVVSEDRPRDIRRMNITSKLLEKYGFTEGCEGCRFKRANLGEIRKHSEACRARLMEAMDGDDWGRAAKAYEEERLTKRLAERVQREVEKEEAKDATVHDPGEAQGFVPGLVLPQYAGRSGGLAGRVGTNAATPNREEETDPCRNPERGGAASPRAAGDEGSGAVRTPHPQESTPAGMFPEGPPSAPMAKSPAQGQESPGLPDSEQGGSDYVRSGDSWTGHRQSSRGPSDPMDRDQGTPSGSPDQGPRGVSPDGRWPKDDEAVGLERSRSPRGKREVPPEQPEGIAVSETPVLAEQVKRPASPSAEVQPRRRINFKTPPGTPRPTVAAAPPAQVLAVRGLLQAGLVHHRCRAARVRAQGGVRHYWGAHYVIFYVFIFISGVYMQSGVWILGTRGALGGPTSRPRTPSRCSSASRCLVSTSCSDCLPQQYK